MSNVEFQNAIPSEFVLKRPVSTSKSILRKNLMEILPIEQTTFAPGQNSIIKFQISSNSDVLCGPESYFKMVFKQTVANHNNIVSLDVGGINALFQSVEIRSLGSGILLQRYDHYNRWNAIQSLLYDSYEEVNTHGQASGDSPTPGGVLLFGPSKPLTGTGFAIVATTGVITGTGSEFLQELQIGDFVRLEGVETADNSYVEGFVTVAPSSNTSVTISFRSAASANITATVMTKHEVSYADGGNMRQAVSDGQEHILTFKPRLSLLTHNLPLFLMKGGIEISFELADAGRGLQLEASSSLSSYGTTAMGYTLTLPRFMAMMVTPHPDIVDEYIRQWKSPAGLLYSIPSVRYRRNGFAGSEPDPALHFSCGVRSARRAYLVIQDTVLSEGGSTVYATNLAPSISGFLKSGVYEYQVMIGSHEYPHRPVRSAVSATDASTTSVRKFGAACEQWEQLRAVSGMNSQPRLRFEEWQSNGSNVYLIGNSAATSQVRDSKHFIMAVDLSRDKGMNGDLTGADLSIVPLDWNIKRHTSHTSLGYPGSCIYHLFVEHDAFLKISSEQMSVMN